MPENNTPSVTGTVSADELTEFVDSRISQHKLSPEELAADINEFITHPDQGLTEEDVRDLINEEGGSDEDDSTEDDSTPDTTDEDLSEQIENVRLTNSPKHTASIDTGVPEGEYHDYGNWGVIVTVDQPVHWRSTVINAEESGMTKLQIFEMDYSEGETYSLQEVHATRELDHDSGQQTVYPDVILPEGQYFICRDPENVTPMREVNTGVNWEDFNQHNVPITVEASWRANANYQPGNPEYEKYQQRNWDQLYYYFGNPKFGFQGEQ